MKKYKCMNIGNCDNANEGKEFEIAEGEELKCPKCKQDMIVEVTSKPWGKIIGIVVAVLAVVGGGIGAFFAFSGDNNIESIGLDRQEITLVVGQKDVVKATATPVDAKATFTYEVTSGNSIEVGSGGEITAVAKGESTITVKCEENAELNATCKVSVTEPAEETPKFVAVESITLEGAFSLKVGESKKLTMAVAPQNHEETLTFQTSDESVATVTSGGEVNAVKAGKATISVTTDKSGKQASVEVTVKAKEKGPEPGGEGGGNGGGNGQGTVNIGFGKYTGPLQNGKPHGVGGEVRVTRSYSLDLKKSPAEYAELSSGDRIVNTKFINGQLKQGEIHFSDGRRKWINL